MKLSILVLLTLLFLTSCGKSEEELRTQRGLEAIVRQLNTKVSFYNQNMTFVEQTKSFNKLYDHYFNIEQDIVELKLESDKLHSFMSLKVSKEGVDNILDSLLTSIINRRKTIKEIEEFLEESSEFDNVLSLYVTDFEKTKRTAFLYQESIERINTMQSKLNDILIDEGFSDTLRIDPSFKFGWLVDQMEVLDNAIQTAKRIEDEKREKSQRLIEENQKRLEELLMMFGDRTRRDISEYSKQNSTISKIKVSNENEFLKRLEIGVFNFRTLYEGNPNLRKEIRITNYLPNKKSWEVGQGSQTIVIPWETVSKAIGEKLATKLSEYYAHR